MNKKDDTFLTIISVLFLPALLILAVICLPFLFITETCLPGSTSLSNWGGRGLKKKEEQCQS